jgi:hypothetical protein
MLYIKMLTCGVAQHTSASDQHTVYCGKQVEFLEALDGPTMVLDGERHHVTGDCWVMNESGKTISQYAVPSKYLNQAVSGATGMCQTVVQGFTQN